MQTKKIFNPLRDSLPVVKKDVPKNALTATAATLGNKDLKATAAIYNEKVGVCPKCQANMSTAQIANTDTVFFCPACRVSTPLAD